MIELTSDESERTSLFVDEEKFKSMFAGSIDYRAVADSYFRGYSHFSVHECMLKDSIRTRCYMLACMHNKKQFEGKIVLDVGAGTGILSIFAAQAGAKHVFAVEKAEIADFAKEIIKENGLSDRITVIKAQIEEVELPVPKVDIIISEWMGYFLFFESMLTSVIFARDKWLDKNGLMLPDYVSLHIAAIEDKQFKTEKFNFWENVYGVNMECIKKYAIAEPQIGLIGKNQIISSSHKVYDLDLYTCSARDIAFSSTYSIKFRKTETMHALVSWFEASFSCLSVPFLLTTSPYCNETHWRQTIFYLRRPVEVTGGTTLSGSIAVRPSEINFRDLDIKISFHYQSEENDSIQLYKLR